MASNKRFYMTKKPFSLNFNTLCVFGTLAKNTNVKNSSIETRMRNKDNGFFRSKCDP